KKKNTTARVGARPSTQELDVEVSGGFRSSCGGTHRARRLSFVALAVLSIGLSACSSRTAKTHVETFGSAPSDWLETGIPVSAGSKWKPAGSLQVKHRHLDLQGKRVLVDPAEFDNFDAQVQFAFSGGGSYRSFAGLFVREVRPGSKFHVLARRESGEWRYYHGDDPTSPSGGRGWVKDATSPVRFRRVGVRVRGSILALLLDGKEVAKGKLSPRGDDGRAFQVGLVNVDATTRWNNLLIWEDGAKFSPAGAENWGSASDSSGLLSEFQRHAEKFRRRPTRAGLLALGSALSGAVRSSPQRSETLSQAALVRKGLESPARRIGESRLLAQAFDFEDNLQDVFGVSQESAAAKAKAAEQSGDAGAALVWYAAALELGRDSEIEAEFSRRQRELKRLSFSADVDSSRAESEILTDRAAAQIVREAYGRLANTKPSDLEIEISIDRAFVDQSVEEDTEREVEVIEGRASATALATQLRKLESQFKADLEDARMRARIILASSQVLGPKVTAQLRNLSLDGETHRVDEPDAKKLSDLHKELSRTRRQHKAQRGRVASRERVKARRVTVSVSAQAHVTVRYRGKVFVDSKTEPAVYEGGELWEHPAKRELGLAASRVRRSDIQSFVVRARERLTSQIRALIGRDSVVARLSKVERLLFLIRIAQATGDLSDRDRLEWYLQQNFRDLTDEHRRRIVTRLVRS
ncbi:MAG: hypothetical protein AAF517_24440, partial [Planctomycetota bacterium]